MAGSAKVPRWLPNAITWSRVAVLAVLAWLVTQGWPGAATLAFGAVVYGAASDWLDGWLARRFDLISNFGKILDALIDKVMVLGCFGLLLGLGLLQPPFLPNVTGLLLVGLMAVREVGITVMRLLATQRGIFLAADPVGKQKTVWQLVAILLLFAVPMLETDLTWWLGLPYVISETVLAMGWAAFLIAAVLTIYSGAIYAVKYIPLLLAPAP